MNCFQVTIFIFLFAINASCRIKDREVKNQPVIGTTNKDAEKITDESINYLKEVNCDSDHPDCSEIIVKFSDGVFSKKEFKETILIIDTGMKYYANIRYRSRTVDWLEPSENGIYKSKDIETSVPKYLYKILKKIDSEKFISAAFFERLYFNMSREIDKYSALFEETEHGNSIFKYLAEYNPSARFVISQNPNFAEIFKESFCNKDFDYIKAMVKKVASSFEKDVIDKYYVKYINASFGDTMITTGHNWRRLCEKTNGTINTEEKIKFLDAISPFYKVLFNTDGVLAFQASGINISPKSHPIDTDESAINRVRVAGFGTLDSNLDADGNHTKGAIPKIGDLHLESSTKWIDLFVNFGILPKRPFPHNKTPVMDIGTFGLNMFPATSITSSWATPVGLSTGIYLKNKWIGDREMTNKDIQLIKEKLTPKGCKSWQKEGRCKMQDPLLYKKHELFRLGLGK